MCRARVAVSCIRVFGSRSLTEPLRAWDRSRAEDPLARQPSLTNPMDAVEGRELDCRRPCRPRIASKSDCELITLVHGTDPSSARTRNARAKEPLAAQREAHRGTCVNLT